MPVKKVTDPQGYEIALEDERWEHIIEGHPEMTEHHDLLLEVMERPELIVGDPERKEVFYYYRLTGRSIFRRNDIYISAVVERSEGNKVGRVKTSHLVKETKKDGVLVWFNRQKS
jgi:hypothetical protein